MQSHQAHRPASPEALAAAWSTPAASSDGLLSQTTRAFERLAPSDSPWAAPLIRTLAEQAATRPSARQALIVFLDSVRRRTFMRALEPAQAELWTELILGAIEAAQYTVQAMIASRERSDPQTVALKTLGPEGCELTMAELARRMRTIARGLLAEMKGQPGPVALLSENNLDSALCDLACLANGIVNVRVPATAVAQQVVYMLRHSQARALVVSGDEQLAKVLPAVGELPALRSIIVVSDGAAARHGLLSLGQVIAAAADINDGPRQALASSVRLPDLATVMYTSGTTGMPKGIMFSQRNLVTKRFCRSLALPQVGEGDVFLCYLPLYHTFGRWLELLGTVFWGATYVFARDPSKPTLLADFAQVRPTVFISVPKKWFELHEQALEQAPDNVPQRLRQLTGGRVRVGLSAAGYLDPLVFRAFQQAGIELCSGYGMTEATGGITMTAPGDYRDGSIGVPLPGIETRIEADGELRIRGPYVMMGYLRPEDGEQGLDAEGWFATGDVVARDDEGHYRIVDRKKEIYKNNKGQTIAPQRVENLFRDFEVIAQAFLVGDHREFNTLLLWPNYQAHPELRHKSDQELRDLLGSLVVSANRFLAPFERVVAFRILPRALSADHGELTPKGTYRRQAIEQAWAELIEPMYQEQLGVLVDDVQLRIPDWVLREMGALRENVAWHSGRLYALDRSVAVTRHEASPHALRVGDFVYCCAQQHFDLGSLLADVHLWLGNDALGHFLGEEAFAAIVSRRRSPEQRIELVAVAEAPDRTRLNTHVPYLNGADFTPRTLHAAAVAMRADRAHAVAAASHLEQALLHGRAEAASQARTILRRMSIIGAPEARRLAFRALVGGESEAELIDTMRRFLANDSSALGTDEDLRVICDAGLPDTHVAKLLEALSSYACVGEEAALEPIEKRLVLGLIRLVAAYAVSHPAWYAKARYPLARLTLHSDVATAAAAGEELDRLQLGFRAWLGPNIRLAVDVESGNEYGWRDVAVFDDTVPAERAQVLLKAMTDTCLVRESVFLFGRGVLLGLADMAPGSMSVSHLGSQHGKSVYRLSIQTRSGTVFDVALNLAESLPVAELREEIRWLMAAGAPPPLVEEFGGYFPEYGIFTEEFIPGETVERQVARLSRLGAHERLRALWPFLVWTALGAQVDFWDRTGRTVALREPAPSNVIVPSHDYQVGTRLVSISDRVPCYSVDELLDRFEQSFVLPMEQAYPWLSNIVSPAILCSAFVEILGLERGLKVLHTAAERSRGAIVRSFIEAVQARGYTPQRLYFAAQRYARWIALNPGATVEARGDMLHQLWDTYRLRHLEAQYPDVRIRFFRQTVFKQARPEIASELDRLMAQARQQRPSDQEMSEQIAALRSSARASEEEDYFLARLAFRHLRPTDRAAIISLSSGPTRLTDVVVTLHDDSGGLFRVRVPILPREVGQLLHLFHEANLPVTLAPEHEYLLAIDDQNKVIGGLFYRIVTADRAYLEKIVVARRHRNKGISDGLMYEFMRRLRSRGVRRVETGFFRPEYMLRFGFRTEPQHSGVVRDLTDEPIERARGSEH